MARRGVALPIVIIAVILALVFGAGVAVVWRTRYFDSTLPAAIKAFFGLEESPSPSETSSETSTETPTPASDGSETPSEDPTKDWKTYTNTVYGYKLKYPVDWEATENAYQGPGGPVTVIKGSEASMDIHVNFQGGFEGSARTETRDYYTANGVQVPATVFYGYGGEVEDKVSIFASPYEFPVNLSFFFSFNQKSYPKGFETFSLIVSSLASE